MVNKAIELALILTGSLSEAVALDAIFMAYQPGVPGSVDLATPVREGVERRLFKLYKDQYELVRSGLDLARHVGCPNDQVALTHICLMFLLHHSEDAPEY